MRTNAASSTPGVWRLLDWKELAADTSTFTAETTILTSKVIVPRDTTLVRVTSYITWGSSVATDVCETSIYVDGTKVASQGEYAPLNIGTLSIRSVQPYLAALQPGTHTVYTTARRAAGTGNITAIGTGAQNSYLLIECAAPPQGF